MKPLLQVGVDSCSEQPAVARMQTTGQVHGATCRSTLLRLTHSPVARGGSQTPRRTDTQLPSAVWPVPQGSLFNVQSLLWAGAGGYDSRSSPRQHGHGWPRHHGLLPPPPVHTPLFLPGRAPLG